MSTIRNIEDCVYTHSVKFSPYDSNYKHTYGAEQMIMLPYQVMPNGTVIVPEVVATEVYFPPLYMSNWNSTNGNDSMVVQRRFAFSATTDMTPQLLYSKNTTPTKLTDDSTDKQCVFPEPGTIAVHNRSFTFIQDTRLKANNTIAADATAPAQAFPLIENSIEMKDCTFDGVGQFIVGGIVRCSYRAQGTNPSSGVLLHVPYDDTNLLAVSERDRTMLGAFPSARIFYRLRKLNAWQHKMLAARATEGSRLNADYAWSNLDRIFPSIPGSTATYNVA